MVYYGGQHYEMKFWPLFKGVAYLRGFPVIMTNVSGCHRWDGRSSGVAIKLYLLSTIQCSKYTEVHA